MATKKNTKTEAEIQQALEAARGRGKKVAATMPAIISPKPNTKPLTQRQERLLKTAAEIADERPDEEDRAYMHSIMCQVGLPRSKVEGTSFERRSGGVALLVEAGSLFDGAKFIQQPLPYGPMPRLMLAWMNTYAVRYNTPEIPVGDSASEFLRMLGKNTNGGRNSAFTTFKKQVQAISACRMTLGFSRLLKYSPLQARPISPFLVRLP